MKKGNPMIQVRLHPDIIKKVEKRAKNMGYIKPSGEANLAGFVNSLIMKDLKEDVEGRIKQNV